MYAVYPERKGQESTEGRLIAYYHSHRKSVCSPRQKPGGLFFHHFRMVESFGSVSVFVGGAEQEQ